MARKASRRAAKSAASETPAEVRRDPIDAALELAATQGWRRTTLGDVAAAAGLPLSELYARYPSKAALLAGFMERTDAAMLAHPGGEEAGESVRDRLFEVIMRRLDALGEHKQAVRSILREAPGDPATFGRSGMRAGKTLSWMLEAAGIDSGGIGGLLRVQGLGLLYLDVLRVWLDDDSPDLSRTMAALDRRLRQAERVLRTFGLRRGDARAADPD